MLELDRFERVHRPSATVVLISGDIDFVGKLNDLRHQAGFQVIVIHNKLAKDELKETANVSYSWNEFTESVQQQELNLENRSARLKVVSNYRKATSKLRKLSLMTKSDLYDKNNPHQNDILYSKPPVMYRYVRSASRNHHRNNRNQSRQRQTIEPVKPMLIYCGGINTPSTASNSIVAPQAQMHQGNSISRLNQRNNSVFRSCERIASAVDDDTAKKEYNSMSCSHCTNEFSTIQALREHQKDKKHLFYCSKCMNDVSTSDGLKYHQIAKACDTSTNIPDQDKLQSDPNENLNMPEHIALFEEKTTTSDDNKRTSEHQNSANNNLTIDRNMNNVNDEV
ncbi:unnamed protein product [Rotaria sp. Silwood1]|nr:unnamed protein product [Rotaria sp. Silwood1]